MNKSFYCLDCEWENELDVPEGFKGDIHIQCSNCGKEWTENLFEDYGDFLCDLMDDLYEAWRGD